MQYVEERNWMMIIWNSDSVQNATAITSIAWSIYLPMNMFRNNLLKFKKGQEDLYEHKLEKYL